MKVSLLAWTSFDDELASECAAWTSTNAVGADALAEFSGRACYEAWGRLNPDTATNHGYLHNIIDHEHFSVLEHASATFYVAGVSRSLLAELTRHRHLSFSVRSQRYVDESNFKVVEPPIMSGSRPLLDLLENVAQLSEEARSHYQTIVTALISMGVPRKQAREAARAVLPQATETRFVVTGNLRAWREVLRKRLAPGADAEIRALAAWILDELKEIAPNTFQDFS